MWKDAAVAYLRHYTGIYLLCLRKNKVNVRQHRPVPGRDLKPDPLKREASLLTTRKKKEVKLIWGTENSISGLFLQWNMTAREQRL